MIRRLMIGIIRVIRVRLLVIWVYWDIIGFGSDDREYKKEDIW